MCPYQLSTSSTSELRTLSRNGERSEYRTEGQGSEQAIPIAVLVDKSTASAAEVLTAALQVRADRVIVIVDTEA